MDNYHQAVLRRLLRQDLNAYRRDYRSLPGVPEAVEHWRHILRKDAERSRRNARKAKREAQTIEAAPDAAA